MEEGGGVGGGGSKPTSVTLATGQGHSYPGMNVWRSRKVIIMHNIKDLAQTSSKKTRTFVVVFQERRQLLP